MALSAGSRLGPYEIIEQAGAGGMGEVFKARDSRLDRTVAIKVLHHQVSANPDLKQRFEREAKAISSLNHPNICTLYDIGEHDGTSYLVMEYVEGETLSERLARGELTNKETLEIAIQISDALDKAHRQGLVHRDMKPGNIMLTKGGAKLLDFGLAKLQADGGVIEGVSGVTRTTPLTGAGTILGTVPYMSPEQLEGKEADARSDIFSFGAVLYEMATGKRAFEGESQASLIAAIMKVNPEPVSRLKPMAPPMFERVVNQCLEKDPENRWQSAGDLKRALKWIAEGGSQAGIPVPVSHRRRFQNRLAWSLVIVLAAATGWLGTIGYIESTRPKLTVKSELTVAEGTSLSGAVGGEICISHDGTRVVYAGLDSTSNGPVLWVRSLNSLTPTPLPGTEDAFFPFWSHDDRYVAFFQGNQLKKILSTGGPVQTLGTVKSGRGGSWNERDVIIFSENATSPLYRVAAVGGQPVQLTTLDTTRQESSHRWPNFLPDGEHFLFFNRGSSGEDAVCIGDLGTGSYRQLFKANSNPVYSAGHILYVVGGTLMAVPFDAGSGELRGDPFPIAEDISYLSNWSRGIFSASRDGQLAYRIGKVGAVTSLVLANRTGAIIDTVDASGEHWRMTLSPDGTRVATDLEEQSQSYTDIWVIDIARKTRTRITFAENADGDPIWSPDGSRLVFESDVPGAEGLYTKSADGTGEPKLIHAHDGRDLYPSRFTPDGRGVIVTRAPAGEGGAGIWYASVDSGQELRMVLDLPENQYDAAVSPDGRWLVYGSDESGQEHIYVTSYPSTQGRWQVSIKDGDRPLWSGDGSKLYYLSNDDEIMEVSVDGSGSAFRVGGITPLFKISNASRPGAIYDVSADGQTFLLNLRPRSQQATSFVLVQNWTAEFAQ